MIYDLILFIILYIVKFDVLCNTFITCSFPSSGGTYLYTDEKLSLVFVDDLHFIILLYPLRDTVPSCSF